MLSRDGRDSIDEHKGQGAYMLCLPVTAHDLKLCNYYGLACQSFSCIMVLFTALTHHRFMLVACKALCKIRILTSNILSSFSYVE
jgi:hypothetical protein